MKGGNEMKTLERLTNDIHEFGAKEKLVIVNLTDAEIRYALWQSSTVLTLVIEQIEMEDDC